VGILLTLLKKLCRHYKLKNLGAFLIVNLCVTVPFLAALAVPVAIPSNPSMGLVVLIIGFLVTGQVLAISGRLLGVRFQDDKVSVKGLGKAWGDAWAEGLVLFSLGTLAVGTLLVLGCLPFYLPVRRRSPFSAFDEYKSGTVEGAYELATSNENQERPSS